MFKVRKRTRIFSIQFFFLLNIILTNPDFQRIISSVINFIRVLSHNKNGFNSPPFDSAPCQVLHFSKTSTSCICLYMGKILYLKLYSFLHHPPKYPLAIFCITRILVHYEFYSCQIISQRSLFSIILSTILHLYLSIYLKSK